MKDITDLSMVGSRLKILQYDIISQALDESSDEPGYYDSLYDLYRKVALTTVEPKVISESYIINDKRYKSLLLGIAGVVAYLYLFLL